MVCEVPVWLKWLQRNSCTKQFLCMVHPHIVAHVSVIYFPPGDVAGQLTAALPTCPGHKFTFTCNVTGGRSGITIWRVNRSSECGLVHSSNSTQICGPNNTLTARAKTGFGPGTNATSFSSTLSGIATPALDGILVECFGPANNLQPGNRINGSTLQILGINWSVYPTHFLCTILLR